MFEGVREEQNKPVDVVGIEDWPQPGFPRSCREFVGQRRFSLGWRPPVPLAFWGLERILCGSAFRPSFWLDSHQPALDSPNTTYVGTVGSVVCLVGISCDVRSQIVNPLYCVPHGVGEQRWGVGSCSQA